MEPALVVPRRIWRKCGSSSGNRSIPEETAVALTYNGGTYAVMMTTPQDLEDFAIGFSLSEGVINSSADVDSLDIVGLDDGVELRIWLSKPGAIRLRERQRRIAGPTGCGLCGIESIAEAMRPPGHTSTLIVPSDCQWSEAGGAAGPRPAVAAPAVPESAVRAAAEILRRDGAKSVLFMGGWALRERGLKAAARIAAASGCRLMCETFPARVERGGAMPPVEKLPYFPEMALEAMARFSSVVLAGTRAPVAFFGYPNMPSVLIPQGRSVTTLATPEQDVALALEALADLIGAPKTAPARAANGPAARPAGALDATTIGAAIAALMPERAIVMDEAATTGLPFFGASLSAPTHTYLALTGGAIGQGLPCATGAAVACPDRRVISFQADGSAMYTVQALWTQAREGLNVTTLLCNNRRYRILQVELGRAGVTEPGPKARSLTSLGLPNLDWVALAKGMGVPGARVETAEALCQELERALKEPGPKLIEMMMI